MKLVAPAVTYNGQRMPVTRPPPYLSQHTDEVSNGAWLDVDIYAEMLPKVLKELGYDVTQIEALRTKGII